MRKELRSGVLRRLVDEMEGDSSAEIVMAELKDFCSPDTPEQAKFVKPAPLFRMSVFKKIDFISCDRRIHASNYGRTNQANEYKDYATALRAKLLATSHPSPPATPNLCPSQNSNNSPRSSFLDLLESRSLAGDDENFVAKISSSGLTRIGCFGNISP